MIRCEFKPRQPVCLERIALGVRYGMLLLVIVVVLVGVYS